MAHLGTLGHYKFQDNVDDVRGTNVYGRDDEKLGTVADVIFDHDTCEIQHIVVDSGGWLSSGRFTIPADNVEIRDSGELQSDLTRNQVQQRFPKYEENVHQDRQRWDDYDRRHRQAYSEAGGVLHREGSPNLITPDPDEMPAAGGDLHGDFTPDRMAGRFPDAAPNANKIRMRPAGTASRAEDASIPGQALSSESGAKWEEPDEAVDAEDRNVNSRNLRSEVTGGGLTQDPRYVRDTGRNISNADLAENADSSAYGDTRRTAVPATTASDPSSYREKFDGAEEDLHRPYPVQQGRNQRFQAFEDTLRRNRVDITASCRSCEPSRDKAA